MLGSIGWSPIRRHFHLAFHTDQSCTESDKDSANYTTAIDDEFGVRRAYSFDKDKQCRRHHPTTKQANNEGIGEPGAFFDAEERSAIGATVCFFTISPIIAQPLLRPETHARNSYKLLLASRFHNYCKTLSTEFLQ